MQPRAPDFPARQFRARRRLLHSGCSPLVFSVLQFCNGGQRLLRVPALSAFLRLRRPGVPPLSVPSPGHVARRRGQSPPAIACLVYLADLVHRRPRAFAGPSRCLATEAAASSSTSAPPPPADPKLNKIVDEISGLTLLQAADLVTLLKVRMRPMRIVPCVSLNPHAFRVVAAEHPGDCHARGASSCTCCRPR